MASSTSLFAHEMRVVDGDALKCSMLHSSNHSRTRLCFELQPVCPTPIAHRIAARHSRHQASAEPALVRMPQQDHHREWYGAKNLASSWRTCSFVTSIQAAALCGTHHHPRTRPLPHTTHRMPFALG